MRGVGFEPKASYSLFRTNATIKSMIPARIGTTKSIKIVEGKFGLHTSVPKRFCGVQNCFASGTANSHVMIGAMTNNASALETIILKEVFIFII